MAPIFAIHTDGLIFDNEFEIVAHWIVALGHHPEGVYCSVPQRLLPEGVAAAYVDVYTVVSAMPAELFAAMGHPLPEDYVPDVRAMNEIEMRSRIPRGPYFALRADGRHSDITDGQLVDWFRDLFQAQPPAENVWYSIPERLLPEGVTVAYFNGLEFFVMHFMEPPPAAVIPAGLAAAIPAGRRPRPKAKSKAKAKAKAKSRADTRPLMTLQWRHENPDEWDRHWQTRPDECPVCLEVPDTWAGPMNGRNPTRCTHWACVSCWIRIAERDRKCPICRDDLSAWLRAR
jgi:hypothetical protein